MRKAMLAVGFALLMALPLMAAPVAHPETTFVGNISDSMCGFHHTMAGGAKACTDECVKMGATYVLADEAAHKVYKLSDQAKAKAFSGRKVRVSGALNGDTIEVKAITGAK